MSIGIKKIVLVALSAGLLSACGGRHYSRARYYPPPPHAVRHGPPGYVWVDGYRDWRGRRYVNVPGRWVRPPRPNAVWVAPAWEYRGHKRHWRKGHWRY